MTEQNQRVEALVHLWRDAASKMTFRHPDRNVTIDLKLQSHYSFDHNGVIATWVFTGLRCTQNGFELPYFKTQMKADIWPGIKSAQFALLGAWLSYICHEAMELVDGPRQWGDTPWDPHSNNAYCPVQKVLDLAWTGAHNLRDTMAFAIGVHAAQKTLDAEAESAFQELKREIEFRAIRVIVDQDPGDES